MADIHIPTVWCCIHGSKAITEVSKDCTFCQDAVKYRPKPEPFSPRCGMCGGPTPCLREN